MQKGLLLAFWAVAAALVFLLVALPISLQTHLIAGLVVVASMIVLKFFRAQGAWRVIALALGTAIVLRYVFWRTTSTLPPLSEMGNYIPAFLLYLAEMYSVMMLFLSLFVVSSPLGSREAPPSTRTICRRWMSSFPATTRVLTFSPRRSRPPRAWPTRRTR